MENKIHRFKKLFDEKIAFDYEGNDEELLLLYQQLICEISSTWENYREFSTSFLIILEQLNLEAWAIGVKVCLDNLTKVLKLKYIEENFSIINSKYDPDTAFSLYEAVTEKNLAEKRMVRFSETEYELGSLSINEQKSIAAFLHDLIGKMCERIIWTNEEIENVALMLIFLKQVAQSLNIPILFYQCAAFYIDRLNTSGRFQIARDNVEELLLTSYKYRNSELGYSLAFRAFGAQGSAHLGLYYINALLFKILNNGVVSEYVLNEIFWNLMKYFRNVGITDFAEQIYSLYPKSLAKKPYNRKAFDHTYFTALLNDFNTALPSKFYDYINANREELIKGGAKEVLPYLVTIYNIEAHYTKDESAQFSAIKSIFESMVPENSIGPYKNILQEKGDLVNDLKTALLKLSETRYKNDFAYDVDFPLVMAKAAMKGIIENEDVEGFLIAMMIKGDFTFAFKNKELNRVENPMDLSQVDKSFDEIYGNPVLRVQNLEFPEQASLLWLAMTKDNVVGLLKDSGNYNFVNLMAWDGNKNIEWRKGFASKMVYVETVKDHGQIRLISPEEYRHQTDLLLEDLLFAKLETSLRGYLLLIKDIEIADYPHNLIVEDDNSFVALKRPVANIISESWLGDRLIANVKFEKRISKSIWIPINSGDFTLNALYGKLEEYLNENAFDVFLKSELEKPLEADVNIIVAHGGENIATFHALYSNNDESFIHLDRLIGTGKILVLLVCYSGSMKVEIFKNKVASFAKTYLDKGYDAVIAPYWSLNISIPAIWLPVFMQNLNDDKTVGESFHLATQRVFDEIPAVGAWGCLHLYGNPFAKIA